ncbi:MAG: hypothetical protein JNL38_20225 [Myxococcales bacterium]|jgi:hypothetical protein|nr:hypothetical protein [Myxococcales bacterium]
MNDLSPRVKEALKTILQRFEEHEFAPMPIVDLGVMIAQADGKFDAAEALALTSLVGRLLGAEMSVDIVELLFKASSEVLELAGFESRARLLGEVLRDCDAVEPAFVVAVELALSTERSPDSLRLVKAAKPAPRRIRDPERRVLEQLADAAGLPRSRLEALLQQAIADAARASQAPPAPPEATEA